MQDLSTWKLFGMSLIGPMLKKDLRKLRTKHGTANWWRMTSCAVEFSIAKHEDVFQQGLLQQCFLLVTLSSSSWVFQLFKLLSYKEDWAQHFIAQHFPIVHLCTFPSYFLERRCVSFQPTAKKAAAAFCVRLCSSLKIYLQRSPLYHHLFSLSHFEACPCFQAAFPFLAVLFAIFFVGAPEQTL